MRSQLVYAKAENVGGHEYIEETYTYAKDGNIEEFMRTVKDSGQDSYNLTTNFGYSGDRMTGATGDEPFTLDNDNNGNTTKLSTTSANDVIEYTWDNKLRTAVKDSNSIAVKYDPFGNRVWKSSIVDSVTTTRKYIVDITGGLPVILCEIDTDDGSLKKSYVYADAQILAQKEYTDPEDPNVYTQSFYVHDRLGSVRMVVQYDDTNEVVETANSYTYTPFGSFYDGVIAQRFVGR